MTKELLLKTAEIMPDTFSMSELLESLLLAESIEDSLKSLREEGGIDHDQVVSDMNDYMKQRRDERNNLV